MRIHFFLIWIVGFLSLLFLGCAATNNTLQQQGKSAYNNENYDLAITHLKAALDQEPENIEIHRDLGLAYFQNLEFKNAIQSFHTVLEKLPNDGKSLFYMGAAYEILNDLDNAIAAYRQYNSVNESLSIRNDLERRLNQLVAKQIQQNVQTVLQNEAHLDTSYVKNNTIAVVYFKYMGNDSTLTPLQKGIAEMLITDLSKASALTVVERLRMQKLLEEIGLGTTGLVDTQSAPRVGKLLGASEIVNGAFIDLAEEQFRIDAGITKTKSGEFEAQDVTGQLESFFRLEKELVFNVLDKMNIELSQDEIDNIRKVPTESMLAFMAYCKAIDYSDRGMYEQASQEFENALQQDPDFDMAQDQLSMIQDISVPMSPIENLIQVAETSFQSTDAASSQSTIASTETVQESTETEETTDADVEESTFTAEVSSGQESELSMDAVTVGEESSDYTGIIEEPTLFDRMQNTQVIIDIGFIPGMESREPVQEQNQPTFGNTANIEIIVPIH